MENIRSNPMREKTRMSGVISNKASLDNFAKLNPNPNYHTHLQTNCNAIKSINHRDSRDNK